MRCRGGRGATELLSASLRISCCRGRYPVMGRAHIMYASFHGTNAKLNVLCMRAVFSISIGVIRRTALMRLSVFLAL